MEDLSPNSSSESEYTVKLHTALKAATATTAAVAREKSSSLLEEKDLNGQVSEQTRLGLNKRKGQRKKTNWYENKKRKGIKKCKKAPK